MDQTIGLASGRTVGFADYGIADATAVLWCHGGPGSRLEPAYLRRQASEAGLRIIGIDRPGYDLSTPQPGRTIAGWVPEALAVADHLGIGPFPRWGSRPAVRTRWRSPRSPRSGSSALSPAAR